MEQGRGRGGRRRDVYPWDKWFDGCWWRLTKKLDFRGSAKSMSTTARVAARRKGFDLEQRVDGDTLYLRTKPRLKLPIHLGPQEEPNGE
jgi:hypothetical protein